MRVRGWWSGAWPTRRSRAFDIAIALSFAVGDGVFLWFADQKFWLPPPVVSACSVVLGLALIVRRSHPVGLTVFAVVFGTVTGAGAFSTLIVLYSLAAYTASRRTVVIIAVTGYVASLVFPAPTAATESFLAQSIFGIAFVGVPVLLGLYMGARKQLLASLQERAARLEREQHLLAERARGEERTRIAREIHDELGQALTALKLDVAWLESRQTRTDSGIFRLGDASLADRVDQTMQIVRRIASELRPSVLDQLGLEAAIESLVRDTTQRTGIAVCFHADDFPRLPDEIASHAFRIIQEALTNVARHSQATRVDVSVRRVGGVIILGVEDNGVGFTPQSLSGLSSLGLVGIRERALACGGTLIIRGEPGRGTGIAVTIPVAKP